MRLGPWRAVRLLWDGAQLVLVRAHEGVDRHRDDRCSLRTRCHGLGRGYLGLDGDAELRPVVA